MDKSHLQNYNISFHIAGTPYQQAGTFSQVSGTSHQQQSQCQQVPATQQVMQQPMQYVPAHQINQQLQFQLAQGRLPLTGAQQQQQPQQQQPQQQPQQQIVAPQQQPSYEHMFHAQGVNKGHQVAVVPQENHQPAPSKDKDLDSIQNAHLEEVRKLQDRIKQLEREKEEKEKLYDRIQRRIRTDQKEVLVAQQEAIIPESDDDGVEVSQTFCPSPERSYSSCSVIKEEPVDNPPPTTENLTKEETTITANRELIGMTTNKEQMEMTANKERMEMTAYKERMEMAANKERMEMEANKEQMEVTSNSEIMSANREISELQTSNDLMEMKIAASQIDGIQPKWTTQPIDFTQCIICQKFADEDLQNLTIEGVQNIRKIVLNRDDEIGHRLLNEGLLDLQLFLKKVPKCHFMCNQNFKMEDNSSIPKQTDFKQCIICQEFTGEQLFNVTERGFPAIQFAVSNKKDLIAKRLAIYVFSQDMFLSFQPKIHRTCRKYVNRKKVLKALNRKETKIHSESKEDDEDIVDPKTGRKLSGEEMLELLRIHKRNKRIVDVAETDTINYDSKCFICRKTRSKTGKEKYIYLDNIRYEKIKKKAESMEDNTILLTLKSVNESERKLQHHKICFKMYINKPIPKINLYNLPYDIAFTCLIKQIEEPMFKQGKAFDVSELRNEYRHYLAEQGITSTIKGFKISDKLRRYYTVHPKRCLVKIRTEIAQSSIVYSKHLSEEEVEFQIEQLKIFKKSNEEVLLGDGNETEESYKESKANQEALQEIIGHNVIASGSNSSIKIDQIFTKYKKLVKPKGTNEEYACSECKYRGNTERALILHMKKHQRELEKPKRQTMCEECGKIFHSKEACNRHKLTHGDRNFLCSHCGRDFHDKYTMRKHVLTHTGEKKYECTLCDMKFITQFYLKKHLLVHTDERPLMCTICGYSCKQKDRLKDHMSKHSDARPYVCNVCGKSFKFRQPLRTHMLLHGEKPCKCPECDFRCYTKGNLKSHMRKHTGEKVYKPPAEKMYKPPAEKAKQINPINTNQELVNDSFNVDNNSSSSYYSYPVSTQDPRLYFPPNRHFQHIPHYLFSNVQPPDTQI